MERRRGGLNTEARRDGGEEERIFPSGIACVLVFMMLLCASLIGCDRASKPRQIVLCGETMGTTYTVKIVEDADAAPAGDEIGAEIEETLKRINGRMSTYDAASELSRWNAWRSSDWFAVSPETAAVVAAAIRAGSMTAGAFDVSVDPLVRLWHFGPSPSANSREADKIPTQAEIAAALRLVDYAKLAARADPPAVRKAEGEMRVDLSGIAKGYGVDCLAELLESRGRRNYMVEIGGEVRAGGRNLAGGEWQIAVEKPLSGGRGIEAVVSLSDSAMATSGDYRNYFEGDGVRYSHIIDPRSGKPIRHRLASVSVLSERCMEADALATGLMVLGPEAGFALAESQGIAAGFIIREGKGFSEKYTSHWPEKVILRGGGERQKQPVAAAETPGTSLWIALAASILAIGAAMAALAVGPVFLGRKRQCSCKAAGQIMAAGKKPAARDPRGSPLLPIIEDRLPNDRS